MASNGILDKAKPTSWTDEEIVNQVRAGDLAQYEIIMRRYNQRLYRVARSILHDDAEAEDVMQDAYVRAYEHLDQFAGRSSFSTWLTRIAVNEALGRLRLRKRHEQIDDAEPDGATAMEMASKSPNPEQVATRMQLSELLEEAVLDLPDQYRTVIMLRDIEGLSTAETAAALDLTEQNVKVRLHRGHGMMREWLFERVGETHSAFPFMGVRCDRVVHGTFARLQNSNP
ncbi:RNA polymerase sigma factor [Edaphobacter bradus]|uniref:RNA polymerase sigma factor n=1 Tax=Edaphobacter bradus TaxID=2259016 RepID=UPI0021E0080D|nr:RNA polymerase sigma factor [Edaphobacter bradus]